MRNTIDPYIGEGFMDVRFVGETIYKGTECRDFAPSDHSF